MPRRVSAVRKGVVASSGSEAPVKPRRSHRKSRNGCAECRRRHIRCDKNHPVCINCSTGDRTCVFPAAAQPSDKVVAAIANGVGVVGGADPQVATPATSDNGPIPIRLEPDAGAHGGEPNIFSAIDLIVFYHAQTAMSAVGLGQKGQFRHVCGIAMKYRYRAPYLLDQVLALAAVHLSMHLPESYADDPPTLSLLTDLTPESLRHHATLRQTRGVTAFNNSLTGDVLEKDDPDSASARLLSAGLLSLQNLAETLSVLRTEQMSFGSFIDSIVDCFNLHRGVRAATGKPIHEFVRRSKDLGPLMDFLNMTSDMDFRTIPSGRECDSLSGILDRSDLGEATLGACKGAVHSLQWSFDMCRDRTLRDGPHLTSAFAVTAPAGYVDALRRYCPEALVILAYYGVLIHRCREYWVFGDAGARMVRAIAEHAGSYWREALSWPLSVIESDDG